MEAQEREALYYQTESGTCPFREWRGRLVDLNVKAAIDARVARLRQGNFGDSRPIGGGASENRINFGPRFRIYYGVHGAFLVLLCGGDKSAQNADIKLALQYWADYKKRIAVRQSQARKRSNGKRGRGRGHE